MAAIKYLLYGYVCDEFYIISCSVTHVDKTTLSVV